LITKLNPPRRNYVAALIPIILIGLGSRRFHIFPTVVGKYPGDVLWAAMVYLIVRLIAPNLSFGKSATIAGAFSMFIEFFKLCRIPQLLHFRATSFGALLLGREFSWMNLVAYAIGIGISVLWELRGGKKRPATSG
jgi:hypothetical protein